MNAFRDKSPCIQKIREKKKNRGTFGRHRKMKIEL
jgi:hypothetical protein